MDGEEAEWIGGPEDGATVILKPGMNHIVIAIPGSEVRAAFRDEDDDGPPESIEMREVIVEVVRRHGRAYLIWPRIKP